MDSKTIPKIIHYCWFGGKRKPKLVRDCLKSWRKYLPDYEIIEWNETNSDLSHPFVKEAYRLKKWAFVSDYIRLNVLYNNGGVYLDTDVLVLKPLNSFLGNECFFGKEDFEIIGSAIIGSIKENKFIYECIKYYDFIDIKKKIIWDEIVNTIIITKLFKERYNDFKSLDNLIKLNNITIYPINVFYPFPYKRKDDIVNYEKYITKDSYAVHLWVGSWKIYNEFNFLRNGEYRKGFKTIYQKFTVENLSFKYFLKILSAIKESLTK
jgi:mannosyltransferase OCH1-like enzyme